MILSKSNLYVLLVLFSITNLYPLWILDYFPSVDGPAHVALTHIWLNYDGADFSIYREFFEKSSINNPNMLIYMLLYVLMLIFPAFVAEKILLSLFVVGLPMSVWYMTSSYNYRGGIIALLSFPLVYNYITYFGFYNFLFGTLLYCITIGFWLRFRDQASRNNILILALLLLISYYTHLSSVVFIILSITAILFFDTSYQLLSGYKNKSEVSNTQILSLRTQLNAFVVASLPVIVLLAIYILIHFNALK